MSRMKVFHRKKKSLKTKTKFEKVEAFGNRCSICGSYFEDVVCSQGHVLGTEVSVQIT